MRISSATGGPAGGATQAQLRQRLEWRACPLPLPTPPPPAGCDSVGLAVRPGLQGSPGAAFLLEMTWNDRAGLLLPSGDNAVPALFLGK